ncbi:MAG: hypothetical protein AAF693_18425 [Bacteroidota bacterium]
MRTLYVGLILVTLFSIKTIAQGTVQDVGSGRVLRKQSYTNIVGSPYLYEDWKDGSVTTTDNKKMDGVKLKYDKYKDELVIVKKSVATVISKEQILMFEIYDLDPESLKERTITFTREYGDGYLMIICEGNMTVLKKYSTRLIEIKSNGYGEAGIQKQFSDNEKYYIIKNDKDREIFKPNKKRLLGYTSDRVDEMKKFMKDNSIDAKSDQDIARFFDYYNSL